MSSEATESGWLYDLLGWADVNKTRLIAAVVVLFIAGLVLSAYLWHQSQRQLEAYAALLGEGLPELASAPPPSIDAYLKVATDFAGTYAAEHALLLAAGETFQGANYAEAQRRFAKFWQEHPDSPLAPTAAFGVAACLDAMNRVDDALQAYQAVLSRYPDWPNAGEARLAIARLDETKQQPAQALKIYEDLLAANPPTAWSAQAEVRRDELLRSHPALAKAQAAPGPGLGFDAGLLPSLSSNRPAGRSAAQPPGATGRAPATRRGASNGPGRSPVKP